MSLEHEVPLAPKTSLGVGGNARFFWRVESEDELVAAVGWAKQRGLPLRVLGGGSNIVVADEGCEGLVIQIALRGVEYGSERAGAVEAAAGECWHDFVLAQVARGHQGVECLAGIPGRLGATPIQNVGAYGQEVAESIVQVRALDVERSRFHDFEGAALGFGYRDSFFKQQPAGAFVVTRVRFRFKPGAAPALRYAELERAAERLQQTDGHEQLTLAQVTRLVLELRRAKSMLVDPEDENTRSCGSFFVNPRVSSAQLAVIAERAGLRQVPHYPEPDGSLKVPAAWLIDQAGLGKGTRRGAVGLSTRHTLSLVCHAGATARAVLEFAHEVRDTVERRFGVRLVPEPVFWGFSGTHPDLPLLPTERATPGTSSKQQDEKL